MAENYISVRDRLIASAIEIISDSGLSALTAKNLSNKENVSETIIYKHFGGIESVLVEVVDYYTVFDENIRRTVKSKESSYMKKIADYMEAYCTYYDNYYSISTLMLQYEELLHNNATRDKISQCISQRLIFLEELFKGAIENQEITDTFTEQELANSLTGLIMIYILKRRIVYHKKTFKQEIKEALKKWFLLLALKNKEV